MRRPVLRLAAGLVAGLLALSLAACDEEEPDQDDGVMEYVALGDSHTAAPHTPEGDLSVPCYRSDDNYPAVLVRLLPDAVLDDVSCSGATIAAMTDEQDSRGTPVPPQLDALSDETDLVTVNVGGNDQGLSVAWFNCYQLTPSDPDGSPCADSNATADGDVLLNKIPKIKEAFASLLDEVKDAAPNATVVVVTYPRVFPDSGDCKLGEPYNYAVGDQGYINLILETLSDAMIDAAKDADVKWVDVYKASRGHDACSKEPWVNGSTTDWTRANFLHPFPEEQAAVAQLIMEQL